MKSWIFCVFLYPLTIISAKKGDKPKLVDKSTGSLTLEVGQTARLKCNFLSWKPEWKMVWEVSGKVVQIRKNKRFRQRNGRSSLLRIKKVVKADSGMYECIASNDYGSVSRVLNLTVVGDKPKLVDKSTGSLTLEVGQTARLKCDFLSWKPEWKMVWKVNGKVVRIRKNTRLRQRNRRSSLLRIKKVVKADSGMYECIASNDYGSVSRLVNLTVVGELKPLGEHGKGPPWFIRAAQPRFVALPASHDMKLRCPADGEPPLKYLWLKDGKVLNYRRLDPKFNSTRWYLRIKTAVPSDNGIYKCVVSNRLGNISHEFQLIVIEKGPVRPVLSAQYPVNKTARIGGNATFQCIELFSPTLTNFRWLHWNRLPPNYPDLGFGDDPPSFNSSYYTVISPLHYKSFPVQKEEGKYGGRVRLTNVAKEDEGMYTCLISNHVGKSWKSAFLRVLNEEKPRNTIKPNESGVTDFTNTSKLIIIIVCVTIAMGLILGSGLIRYYGRQRYKAKINSGNQQDPLNSVSSANPNCSFNPLLERHKELIDNDNWNIDRNNIRLLGTIDEGAYGRVFKAKAYVPKFKTEWITVAVKTLKDDATDVELAVLVSELEVMKKIGRHKNIINLVGCCTQNDPLLVILEYAPGGNLRHYLRDRRHASELLSLRDLTSFIYQVARGMEFLASMKCIHRDLAARNVLVGDDQVMKIADFGLAKDKTDYYRKNTGGLLPIKWMALEAMFDQVYTTQSDVWAFGILMWEVFTLGGTPYPSVPVENLFELLISGYRMERPINCPPELHELSLRCWSEKPECRPSFPEIVKELNEVLENLTDGYYKVVEVEAPLLSPRTPSILSVRTSWENVTVHEENIIEDEDAAEVNENSEFSKRTERRSMENIIANEEYAIEEKDEAQVNENGESDERPEQRSTENIIVNRKYVIKNKDEAQVNENNESDRRPEERSMGNIIINEENVINEVEAKACLNEDTEPDEKPEERSSDSGVAKFKWNFKAGDEYVVLLGNESKAIENC